MILLDTNFIIDFLNGEKAAIEKMSKIDQEDILCTTLINVCEALMGFYRAGEETTEFNEFVRRLHILTFEYGSADVAAKIAAKLKKKGEIISNEDCLIAGIALANNCRRIVTNNVKHFDRIEDINVENY